MGKECNPSLLSGALQHHLHGQDDQTAAEQSKDAIIYVTIVVVFYVAIVLLLIGTNLRSGRSGHSGEDENNQQDQKRHVVEYTEGTGKTETRLVSRQNSTLSGHDLECEEDEVVEV